MKVANKASMRTMLLQLPEDLALDLDAFCALHFNATRAVVIREAIRRLIGEEVAANPCFRERMAQKTERLQKARDAARKRLTGEGQCDRDSR